LIDAVSIDERGQILVTAVRDGVTSALVLTPSAS
jgi:hypothetical protein